MEPKITEFNKLSKIINIYSNNNKYNFYDSFLFNLIIFVIFLLITCFYLSYKYRIKHNISF